MTKCGDPPVQICSNSVPNWDNTARALRFSTNPICFANPRRKVAASALGVEGLMAARTAPRYYREF